MPEPDFPTGAQLAELERLRNNWDGTGSHIYIRMLSYHAPGLIRAAKERAGFDTAIEEWKRFAALTTKLVWDRDEMETLVIGKYPEQLSEYIDRLRAERDALQRKVGEAFLDGADSRFLAIEAERDALQAQLQKLKGNAANFNAASAPSAAMMQVMSVRFMAPWRCRCGAIVSANEDHGAEQLCQNPGVDYVPVLTYAPAHHDLVAELEREKAALQKQLDYWRATFARYTDAATKAGFVFSSGLSGFLSEHNPELANCVQLSTEDRAALQSRLDEALAALKPLAAIWERATTTTREMYISTDCKLADCERAAAVVERNRA